MPNRVSEAIEVPHAGALAGCGTSIRSSISRADPRLLSKPATVESAQRSLRAGVNDEHIAIRDGRVAGAGQLLRVHGLLPAHPGERSAPSAPCPCTRTSPSSAAVNPRKPPGTLCAPLLQTVCNAFVKKKLSSPDPALVFWRAYGAMREVRNIHAQRGEERGQAGRVGTPGVAPASANCSRQLLSESVVFSCASPLNPPCASEPAPRVPSAGAPSTIPSATSLDPARGRAALRSPG
ncbi:hypothetical protein T492DRAFT_840583 [Pavlovales sp. CCMP2436]|nr:hypothetical protein T492DRAFT_840583 [Pavlovales sp. CCMP2436]